MAIANDTEEEGSSVRNVLQALWESTPTMMNRTDTGRGDRGK